ncbi:hypothetical protein QAD02_017641 [Eretmocerus hayati]|uniref:Uncharacterized protein n=1 Tax=Eretmocerus hayati TaxID=131215 RepID=A0ACC2PE62_9HYME|nr:hypothetical protein QAD02_017641 [Eretmocerus hayati]
MSSAGFESCNDNNGDSCAAIQLRNQGCEGSNVTHDLNVSSQPVQDVDYSVFDNQNVQYAYHQLPNVWDQALQDQTCSTIISSCEDSKDYDRRNIVSLNHCYFNLHGQVHG